MPAYGSLARNQDFTALWVSGTVSELGTRVSTFALPLVGYALTGSATWAAACEALYVLGMVVALLPAGVLADRVHRLRLLRLSLGGGAVLYLSLVVAGLTDTLTLPHLLAGALGSGVLAGLYQPVESSAIRSVVLPEDLPTALSQQQGRQHVASLLGGPLGGVLVSLARWAPFLADAASYALGWVLLGRVRSDLSAEPTPHRARPLRDLAEGLRFTWSQPIFRVLLAWSPAVNLVLNAILFVALLRVVEAGFPGWQIGLAEAATGMSGILGALAAPWLIDRLRTGRLTIAVAWSFVPLAIPLAAWNHPVAMTAAASAALFLVPAGNAGLSSYRITITPPALVGRVQATAQFVSMLVMPLAPLFGGFLLEVAGGTRAVLALGALTALVALVPTLSRSVRSVPRPAAWPAPPEVPETASVAAPSPGLLTSA